MFEGCLQQASLGLCNCLSKLLSLVTKMLSSHGLDSGILPRALEKPYIIIC